MAVGIQLERLRQTIGSSGASVLHQIIFSELLKNKGKILQNFLFASLYYSWCNSSAGASAIKKPWGPGFKVPDTQDLLSFYDAQLSHNLLSYGDATF